ncbi:TonB-dependent receptor [Asticcacaulis sp. 201]|uniref:TonB-dependent receptor n=1 Tax=Asticcacaulis sp. 201 TaxID=3028787 RepID=UPI002915E8A6|nr:TonB-dependent receptor [Asticcacaulis sp. 201]MDV6329883.1 TonB-dependent receptor [Asticcacaulis sp. 201]
MKRSKTGPKSGLMATTTLCGAVLSGLAAPAALVTFGLVTAVSLAPHAAQAQDYTSGAVIGSVKGKNGPVAGATITLTSKAQGQTRTLTSSAAGTFSATGLAPGDYNIAVTADGYDDYTSSFTVVIAQEVRFEAALQVTGGAQTVVVKGKRVRQDFTKTTSGLTVDLDTLTSQQPIARSITAVAMLAPTVTQGNPNFGDVPSIGGSSVAENAYYIDGLNITNPDTYVGSAKVPFDFYKTVDIQTSGYAAEFGRATGGVVNATTKSGTNEFKFALHGNYQPSDLSSEQADTYAYRGKYSTLTNNSASVEVSGPILKDRLFFYGLYQANDYEKTTAGIYTKKYTDTKNTDPFFGGKLDAYITPTQHLSLTYFDTSNVDKSTLYTYTDSTQTIGSKSGYTETEYGGKNWVLNYNGKVTDWFSISAAVGDSQDRTNVKPADTSGYYVVDYRSGTATVISQQASSSYNTQESERKFWRMDGDVRFDAWGHHHIRFGIDNEKNSELKTTKLTGTDPVQYQYRNVGGVTYLRVVYENLGGNVSSENQAMYLQDSWDVTPTFNLQIGVRDDNFKQFNLSGEQYMDLKNNVAPRLGFSWDPTGDGKWKVFGSYGTNYIPPAMNLGFRGKDLYYAEYFSAPTGGWVIDSTTGLPASVGNPVVLSSSYTSPCPTSTLSSAPGFNSTNAAAGTAACVVYGNGQQEGATSKTSIGLKATQSNEVTLGAKYRFNDLWSGGVTAVYRNVKNVSEDSDFNDAIISYLNAAGLDSSQWVGGSSYYVWNVGDHDVTIRLKNILPGESEARVITLTADQLGHYKNAKREYKALTFDFKRAFDGKWGLQGSYTWSRLYGNYNGTVTEYGNTVQTDAGATYAWDSPGMENYGTGLLGNSREHTLKVFGSYAVTPELLVGANLLIQSPEHLSCLGYNVDDAYAAGYNQVSHYCGGVGVPAGTSLTTNWTRNIDVSLRYTVPSQFSLGGKLILRADIFNLFNQHTVVTRYVVYDYDVTHTVVDPNYGKATAYNSPRYLRLGFDLSY